MLITLPFNTEAPNRLKTALVIFFLTCMASMAQAETIRNDCLSSQVQVTPRASGNFITTWKTSNSGTSGNQQITIPIKGTGYHYDVYWKNVNDASQHGMVSAITGSTTLSFPEGGTYRVEISGAFPQIFFNNGGDRLKILSVDQWGTTKWRSMENAFRGAANLQINAEDAPDLSIAKDMAGMFRGATVMNNPIGHWDVSNIEVMTEAFNDAAAFNQDLNEWKVSNVTTMYRMFTGASKFNGNIGNWNVSKVTKMGWMFSRATTFNQDLNSWDVSKVTNMEFMFYGAGAFDGNIGNWNVSNVTNMGYMFGDATTFNQDLDNWNVSRVRNMEYMFRNAIRFDGRIESWKVLNVTNMEYMFVGATAFNRNLNSWDISSVSNLRGMFNGATAFNKSLNKWVTSNVTDMDVMFFRARAFNQDLKNWDVSKVTNMRNMFNGAAAFNRNLGGWDVSKVTNMLGMLNSSGLSAQNYDATLIGWAARGNLQKWVSLGANDLLYCEGEVARQQLIDTYGWSISGDKKDGACGIIPSADRIVYVSSAVSGGNGSGDSWANAVKELADALRWARLKWGPGAGWDAGNPLKIYVAKGTYKPQYTAGSGGLISPYSRENSFVMVPSTQLYGGFDPANGITNLTHRRILPPLGPGAVGLADGTVLDGRASNGQQDVYHVVITAGSAIDDSFLMDGFTIRNGYGNQNMSILVNGKNVHHRWGAGWYNAEANPRINNVCIANASVEGDGLGAGMYNAGGNPKMSNMIIRGNRASHKGGGIYSGPPSGIPLRMMDEMNAELLSAPSLTNVIISGNAAPEGAGIYNLESHPVLTNVTISGNSSAGMVNEASFPVIRNSILWGNGVGISDIGQGKATVSYSIVQAGYQGVNVLTIDPLFVHMPGYTTAPFLTSNYTFTTSSPAFHAGDPLTNTAGYAVQTGTTDLAGNVRTQNGRIELGAYEVTCTQVTLAADQTSVTRLLSDIRNDFFDGCSLVAMVAPTGSAAPVSGMMTAQTWTESGIVSFGNARYLRRHYDLAPVTNNENATADITLYYTQDDFKAYNDAYGTSNNAQLPTSQTDNLSGNIRIAQFRGDYALTGLSIGHQEQPTYIIPKSVIWNETSRFWEVTFGVTGFSGFFLTGQSDAVLPVTLVSFSAKKQDNGIQLTWQTSSESNSSHFEVQRSTDSRHFETIGTVNAAGLSTKPWVYYHTDPAAEVHEVLYYRLKMVDHDGSFAHSRIASVNGGANLDQLIVRVCPNPSNGRITIETTGLIEPGVITVYNLLGQKIRVSRQPISAGKTQLDFRGQPSGIYTVVVEQGSQVVVKKIAVE